MENKHRSLPPSTRLENKFRVWDGKHLLEFKDITEWDFSDYDDFIKACQNGGVPPLRFTGLVDEYDNEIFEGDILRVTPNSEYFNQLYVIEKRAWAFCMIGQTKNITPFTEYTINTITDPIKKVRRVEVIGNIYEHGHLLK